MHSCRSSQVMTPAAAHPQCWSHQLNEPPTTRASLGIQVLLDWWALQENKWVWNQLKQVHCCCKLKLTSHQKHLCSSFCDVSTRASVVSRARLGPMDREEDRWVEGHRYWPSAVLNFLSWLTKQRVPVWTGSYISSHVWMNLSLLPLIFALNHHILFILNTCLLKNGQQVLRWLAFKIEFSVSSLYHPTKALHAYCYKGRFFFLLLFSQLHSKKKKNFPKWILCWRNSPISIWTTHCVTSAP